MDDYGQFVDIEMMNNIYRENTTYIDYKNSIRCEEFGTNVDDISIFPLIVKYILFFINRLAAA